jgi:hypothetical protein
MTDIDSAKVNKHFASKPYRAETFKTGISTVVNSLGINCLILEHGRTLTDTMSAKIIAERWNTQAP